MWSAYGIFHLAFFHRLNVSTSFHLGCAIILLSVTILHLGCAIIIGARGLWKCVRIGQNPDLSDLQARRMHPQAGLNSYQSFLHFAFR